MARRGEVALLLGAEHVFGELTAGRGEAELGVSWLPGLLRAVADLVERSSAAQGRLTELLQTNNAAMHPMAASVMVMAGTGWRPRRPAAPCLNGAILPQAPWESADLRGLNMQNAHLSGADLRGARMTGADLTHAKLNHADLCGAALSRVKALCADFSGAKLLDARAAGIVLDHATLRAVHADRAVFKAARFEATNLSEARFVDADLSDCHMRRASVRGADFTGARFESATLDHVALHAATLTAAVFTRATLEGCDLEYVQMPDAPFRWADLSHALLTGSVMPHADFRGARFCNAGLAEVEWEQADLRDTDFSAASFHMGSSRSGRVGSTVPCEGSRTGFYTDEFHEQEFKPPEEIRKANLCGADLRGARVNDADFYLVDLRGAHYTPDQAEHFRRCGAILGPRR